MATTGKVPFLGFKAGAVRFLTLLGFSMGAVLVEDAYVQDFFVATSSPLFLEATSSPLYFDATHEPIYIEAGL